jgi:hypothetical protein
MELFVLRYRVWLRYRVCLALTISLLLHLLSQTSCSRGKRQKRSCHCQIEQEEGERGCPCTRCCSEGASTSQGSSQAKVTYFQGPQVFPCCLSCCFPSSHKEAQEGHHCQDAKPIICCQGDSNGDSSSKYARPRCNRRRFKCNLLYFSSRRQL